MFDVLRMSFMFARWCEGGRENKDESKPHKRSLTVYSRVHVKYVQGRKRQWQCSVQQHGKNLWKMTKL